MSLVMHVEFLETSAKTARELADKAQREYGLAVRRDRALVQLTEAHDALTDQADWNAPFWDMDPAALQRLDRAVRVLYELSPKGIAVQAIRVSDKVRETRTVSIEQMSEVLRQSRLGTHTCYHVPKAMRHGDVTCDMGRDLRHARRREELTKSKPSVRVVDLKSVGP